MITNRTLWILSKIMFEATLFNSKTSKSIAAGALNGIEKGLILTGRCYWRSQIDIVRVRQYWNSICQVRPTTVQLGKDFLRIWIQAFYFCLNCGRDLMTKMWQKIWATVQEKPPEFHKIIMWPKYQSNCVLYLKEILKTGRSNWTVSKTTSLDRFTYNHNNVTISLVSLLSV